MRVAVMGHGIVGGSLVKLLDARDDVTVKYILEMPDRCTEERMVSDVDILCNDPEVELIVDALPAIHPSYEYIKKALESGKHVVTSNKAALCYGFRELVELAEEKGLSLRYEASCGGTIPCIHEAAELAKTNEITACYGIMNGTTNFILYKMLTKGTDFDETLKQAQELGYAEKDPTADLSGFDVKNKLVILSNTAYQGFVNSEFPMIGIENITLEAMKQLNESGYGVKLMGLSVRKGNSYALGVVPVILPGGALEASVPDNYNMFTLCCSNAGPVKLYGQGAGGVPTADAMVRDILSVMHTKKENTQPYFKNELTYDPSILTGGAIIGGEKYWGRLDELSEQAKQHNVFFAFEPDFLK